MIDNEETNATVEQYRLKLRLMEHVLVYQLMGLGTSLSITMVQKLSHHL